MGDGIGSHMDQKSSSEDFAVLDGKIVKLGMSYLIEETPLDLKQTKQIQTTSSEYLPLTSSCTLTFTPQMKREIQTYAIVLAFS